MNFRVGQKVVCVDASTRSYNAVPPALVLNRVYTIAGMGSFSDSSGKLILAEQPGQNRDGLLRAGHGFRADRFRPVVERSTDAGMAILKKIADDATKKRALTVAEK